MIKFISIYSNGDVKVKKVDELFPDEFVGPHYSHKVLDDISDIYLISRNELIGDRNPLIDNIISNFPCYGTCLIVRYDCNNVANPYISLDSEDVDYFLEKLGVSIEE